MQTDKMESLNLINSLIMDSRQLGMQQVEVHLEELVDHIWENRFFITHLTKITRA